MSDEDDYAFEDWVDSFATQELTPFPDAQVYEASEPVLFMTALALISNVLRDSELVDDLTLKATTLQRVLRSWGTLVSLLEEDGPYIELVRRVGDVLADTLGVPASKREGFLDDFVESGPLLVGFGGMATTLASRKLERILTMCFADRGLGDTPGEAVMGALLAALVGHKEWTDYFIRVQERHHSVPAVSLTLKQIGLRAYLAGGLPAQQEEQLERFLAIQYSSSTRKAPTPAEIEGHRQQLRAQRRVISVKRRELSMRPADETDADVLP